MLRIYDSTAKLETFSYKMPLDTEVHFLKSKENCEFQIVVEENCEPPRLDLENAKLQNEDLKNCELKNEEKKLNIDTFLSDKKGQVKKEKTQPNENWKILRKNVRDKGGNIQSKSNEKWQILRNNLKEKRIIWYNGNLDQLKDIEEDLNVFVSERESEERIINFSLAFFLLQFISIIALLSIILGNFKQITISKYQPEISQSWPQHKSILILQNGSVFDIEMINDKKFQMKMLLQLPKKNGLKYFGFKDAKGKIIDNKLCKKIKN